MEKLLMESRELGILFQEKFIPRLDAIIKEALIIRQILAKEETTVGVAPLDQLLTDLDDFLVKVRDLENDTFLVDFMNNHNLIFPSLFRLSTNHVHATRRGRSRVGFRSTTLDSSRILTRTHRRRRGRGAARAFIAGIHRDHTTSRPRRRMKSRGFRATERIGRVLGFSSGKNHKGRRTHEGGEVSREALGDRNSQRRTPLSIKIIGRAKR
mmetsp:Transcript_11715/g.17761  ORF Transcript_11715/g.17761 Transcript_11715/m.17761 type:complete len:211 (+) Transcript_11715:1026-1658(+)